MIHFHNVRISIFSDTLFRVEFQPQKKFENKPTLLMGTSLPKEINQYEVKEEENRIIIKTKKCKCIYEVKGRNFHKDKLEVTYTYGKKKKVWNRSSKHTQEIPEVSMSLDQWPQGLKRNYKPIIINNDGWHTIVDNAGAYWDTSKNWVKVKRPEYYENLYLFFYGDDIAQAFKDFTHLFGKSPLLPRQAFGTWYSRWHDYSSDDLRALVKKYKKHNIPLDVLVIDVDWHKEHWNGYDWRKKSFPDHKKFIKEMKKKNLKLVLNDHPGYDLFDPLPEDDSHLKKIKKEVNEAPYKGMWACDWSRASIVKQWGEKCLQDLLSQGIDWWWIDGWGDTPFPDIDSQYWLNWQYYKFTKEFRPEKRSLILSRWGGIGSHKFPVQFSGDTHAVFDNLDHQIYYTAYSGGIGAYYWSHDIGGFHEGTVDEELFIRWVQFGTLSPIFRTHSNHGIREPFNFSQKALNICQNYIHLRYKLIPYFEQLQFLNHKEGFPLVYPLSFVDPGRKEVHRFKKQYYLGKSILVAPVASEIKKKEKKIEKEVWLPKGQWLDLEVGKWRTGEKEFIKKVTTEHIPIFIKKGSIIPTMPPISPIPSGKYEDITFNIFDFETSAQETFYFDDGESYHLMEKKNISSFSLSYKIIKNIGVLKLTLNGNKKYIPLRLHFECISDKIDYKTAKEGEEGRSSFVNEFSGKTMKALVWSIKQKDIKKELTWEIPFVT